VEFPRFAPGDTKILYWWGWLVPLYVLSCKKCEKLWELLIKLNDFDKDVECPECGEKLNRLMTPVQFKIN